MTADPWFVGLNIVGLGIVALLFVWSCALIVRILVGGR